MAKHEPGKIPTFREASDEVLALQVKGGVSGSKGRRVVESILNIYVYPFIGDKTLDKITSRELMACLDPIWFEKRVSAIKAFKQIRAVMGWGMGRGIHRTGPDRMDPGGPWTEPAHNRAHAISASQPDRGDSEDHRRVQGALGDQGSRPVPGLDGQQTRCGPTGEMGRDRSCQGHLDHSGQSRQEPGGVRSAPQPPSPFGASQGPRTHRRCGTGVSLTPGTAYFRLDDEQALPREPGWLRPVRYSQHLQGMVRGSGGAPPGCGGLYGTHLRWSPARSGPCGAQASGDGGLGATSIPTCSPPVRCRPLASDQPKNRAEPSINLRPLRRVPD